MTKFKTRFTATRKPMQITAKSMTKQSFKDEVDIYNVLEKYKNTGILPRPRGELSYGDFSQVGSFQEAVHMVQQAEEQFMELPSHIRDQFGHDPVAFVAFVENPKNQEELVKMGLATQTIQLSKNDTPPKTEPPKEEPSKSKD